MEEAKGLVKHMLLVRGRDVSIENLHQGFTHVLETTFESIEGIAQYLPHLAHVEFSKQFVPQLEKVLVVNFKPTIVHKQYSADVMLI
ncbi:hypothetical protein BT93_E2399 [Corymbia citriodora subsp. variegata]|nr:hypothetical protein BT93_E2399 [Corymbia citriodora subsp. variegata]